MKIYEIDREIAALLDGGIDEETGELLVDTEALEELQMAREEKVENLALAVKNLTAEAHAIRDEEEALAKRRKQTESKADRARQYLAFILAGEKFKTPRVAVGYRKSTRLELAQNFVEWAQAYDETLLRYKLPEPDKVTITARLKAGEEIPGASLVESQSITIK